MVLFDKVMYGFKAFEAKRMGLEYILEAMQHHGLGHLPQPDNFTTCGRLGIEINQYNNPVECYNDDTIEEMRDEKSSKCARAGAGCAEFGLLEG